MKTKKVIIEVRNYKTKMDSEELQEYLKLKRGNGAHRSKKDYNRQKMKRISW